MVIGDSDQRAGFSLVETSGCGEVDAAGHYVAPAAVPTPASCRVRATSLSTGAHADATVNVVASGTVGTPGAWQACELPVGVDLTGAGSGGVQTILVDPVRPSDFYAFVNTIDSEPVVVLRSTDFGASWTSISQTPEMTGTPWGAAIDPNPERDPATPPTLYSPAGFGANGLWKSTDGGVHWTNMLAGDTVFDPYSPYGPVDVYGIVVLPDDPPNHILFTYHYGFAGPLAPQASDGGFGESTDGGETWQVHVPPAGIGNSHYLVPIDSQTWLAIAQNNDGANGEDNV